MTAATKLLQGLQVVELGQGPLTGLVTAVLADFGAEVLWLDPQREPRPYAVWQRGKRRLVVDPAADAERMRAAVLRHDVFVSDLPPRQLQALGLDAEGLAEQAPALVSARLSAFPGQDELAELPPLEGLAAAFMGRMQAFEGVAQRDGPVCAALPVATHAAAQSACAGILAALLARRDGGRGQHLETSLLHGLLPYELYQLMGLETGQPAPMPGPHEAMPTLNYHPVRCADGRWLQLGNLLPHLFENFLRAADLTEILDDPAFPAPPWPPEVLERWRRLLLEHMQQQDLATWMQRFVADGGVAAHPYQSTREALDDPDVRANGHAVEAHGMLQLGVLARLDATPGSVAPPPRDIDWSDLPAASEPAAPWRAAPGQAAPEPAAPWQAAPERGTPRSNAQALPLEGVTVLECASIIAAPLGASLLGDLGARVIKVEPLGGAVPGDPFRAMLNGLGAARVNNGKESICIDLKREAGRTVLAALARRADVVIHNYRSGVPERLGLGYEALRVLNPRLVYLAVNGYGPDGPGARRPSTHPIPGAALGGVLHQMGGRPDDGPRSLEALRDEARRLFRANDVNPDPNTSMVVATAALLGLHASRRFGAGQRVWVDMFGANAWANFDDFLDYPGKPPRPRLDAALLGFGPLMRLYRCATGWVFLGVDDEERWQRLRQAVAPALDAFAGLALAQRSAGLDEALQALFVRQPADHWEARLVPLGVGCVRADRGLPGERLHGDPYFARHGLLADVAESPWGAYRRHGPQLRLSSGFRAPGACAAGAHSRALLAELGHDPATIESLIAEGTIR